MEDIRKEWRAAVDLMMQISKWCIRERISYDGKLGMAALLLAYGIAKETGFSNDQFLGIVQAVMETCDAAVENATEEQLMIVDLQVAKDIEELRKEGIEI